MTKFPSKREIKDSLWAEILGEHAENVPKTLDEGLIWLEEMADKRYKDEYIHWKNQQPQEVFVNE